MVPEPESVSVLVPIGFAVLATMSFTLTGTVSRFLAMKGPIKSA